MVVFSELLCAFTITTATRFQSLRRGRPLPRTRGCLSRQHRQEAPRLTGVDELVGAVEELAARRVLVRVEAQHEAVVEADARPRGDHAAEPAAERRLQQVLVGPAQLGEHVQVLVLTTAAAPRTSTGVFAIPRNA